MKDKKRRYILFFMLLAMIFCAQPVSATATENGQTTSYNLVKIMSHTGNREGDWVLTKKGYRFRLKDTKQYLKKCWAKIGNAIYRFDSYGYRRTGMYSYRGQKYYLRKNGRLAIDFWLTNGSRRLYFKPDGTMATGFYTIGGETYYFNKSGIMVRGLCRIDKKMYYFESDGTMATGWKNVKDSSSGKTYRYYFRKSNGAAVTGWFHVKSGSYYFSSDGKMTTSQWVGGFYLDRTGHLQTKDT